MPLLGYGIGRLDVFRGDGVQGGGRRRINDPTWQVNGVSEVVNV